jgi:hypothetical protein
VPSQLSFSNPQAYADIYPVGSYTGAKAYLKEPYFYAFQTYMSVFPQVDPAEAAWRKRIINPFFSRRAIMELEGVIQSKVCR